MVQFLHPFFCGSSTFGMVSLKYIVCFLILWNLAFATETVSFFEGIQQQDIENMVANFDELENSDIDIEDCKAIISDLVQALERNFKHKISIEKAKIKSFEYIESSGLTVNKKEQLLEVIESISNPVDFSLNSIHYLKCKKKQKKKDVNIPSGVVIGGVEILGGALLWVIPWGPTRALGTAMMADGIRRALNTTEEEEGKKSQNVTEEENKKNQDVNETSSLDFNQFFPQRC